MALDRPTLVFVCGLFVCIKQGQSTDLFLPRQIQRGGSLLADLEAVLGRDGLRGRVEKLEVRLRPMFFSLPKKSTDIVGHATARYALHRANLDLHGWNIRGLEPTVTTFNTTSLVGSGILRGLLPSYVEDILKAHISTDGFGLRDLAVLAGTIEHFVHEGHRSILLKVCDVFDLPTLGPMREEDMMMIIRLYKVSLLLGISAKHLEQLTRRKVERILSEAERAYAGWVDASSFVDDERTALAFSQRHSTNPFKDHEGSLQIALQVVGQVADHYTHKIYEPECQEIKEDLLMFERGDTGRVRLVDFYRAGLNSRFFYTETKEYLHAIGALDESDMVGGPKVIVPNYLLAKNNCMARTYIYNICCVNECEGLYGQLEHGIVAADSTPEQILSLVASISSSTVQAPRNLSGTLRSRLEEIAIGNGGRVLLHSRLFAQWMHQAFPRECPYPHLVGTTTSLSPNAWTRQTGLEFRIDTNISAQIVLGDHIDALERSFVQPDVESAAEGERAELMWTAEEEHFIESTMPLGKWVGLAIKTLPSRLLGPLAICGVLVGLSAVKSRLPSGGAKADNFAV